MVTDLEINILRLLLGSNRLYSMCVQLKSPLCLYAQFLCQCVYDVFLFPCVYILFTHIHYPLGWIPTFLALSYFWTKCLLQNERSVLRDDHRRSPQRNLKEESEPIFSAVAVESGTHYDSLRAEMLWMMSESDIRASVRCHGDAQPNVTELREQ